MNIQENAHLITEVMNDLTGDIVKRYPQLPNLWFAAFYMDPQYRAFYATRGVVAHIMNDFSMAIRSYDEALRREPPPNQECSSIMDMIHEIHTYRNLALDDQPLPFDLTCY